MNCCDCSHPPSTHCDGIGRCDAAEVTLWGDEKVCNCPAYTWQGDE